MEPSADDFKKSGNDAFLGGRFEEAVALFSMGVEVAPENEVLYSNRSGAYCKMGKWDAALEDAETVLRLKSDWARGYSRKAAALEGLGKDEEALALYTESLKRDSKNNAVKAAVEALVMRRETRKDKLAEETSADAQQAAELQRKGNAMKKDGDLAGAVDAYTNALRYQHNDEKKAALYSNLSAVKLLQDKYEEALQDAHRCVDLRPDWVRGYTRRGASLWQLKRYAQARAAYTEALLYDTNNDELRQIILKIEDEARVAAMKEANPHDPAAVAAEHKLKGNKALKENRLSDALEQYTLGLEAEPKNHILLSNRAAVHLQMGHAQESLEDAIKTTQIEPTFAKGFARKGAAIEALSIPADVAAALAANSECVDYACVDYKRLRGAVKAFLDAAELPSSSSDSYTEKAFALEKLVATAEEATVAKHAAEKKKEDEEAEAVDNALLKGILVATSTDKSKTHQLAIVEEPEVQGDRKYDMEDFRGAIGYYSQALKQEPAYQLFMKRAICWTKVRRFQKALADFSSALEMNPNHTEPYWQKGQVLMKMANQELDTDPHAAGPRFDEAIALYTKGKEMDQETPSRFDGAIQHAQNEKAAFEMTKADRIAILERTKAKGKSRSKLDWKNMPEEEVRRRKEDMKRKADAALFESDSYLQKQIRRGNHAAVGLQQQKKRAKKFHSGVQQKYTFTDGGL
eukprot:TRINITY_DN14284_c0_g1_i1.p1 TRINITY_DN14284_c0_g1~~TRINITY_DN14284_c0_g1_i1.p1  ORF type:complete len:690 (+),score=209.50 TRINITY_DN14284_c0_g1_i1:64-2133(+)